MFSILVLVGGIIPSSFAATHSTLGDAWSSIKTSLENAEKAANIDDSIKHLNDAKKTYVDHFQSAAQELDAESHDLISTAFTDIENLLKEGNIDQAKLERQVVDKTIYKIAFVKIEQALENNDSDGLFKWYDVMEKKFKISEKSDFQSNLAFEKIKANSAELQNHSETITGELLGIFKLKTIEEIEEAIGALENDNVADAKKFAYEGLYYYRTLHPSIEATLGPESANELLHEMEEVIEVVESDMSIDEMKDELNHILDEVELIIREYEGGDTSEVGLALSGIYDRLNLVEEEYAAAVTDGKIVDQEEYDETVVFLAKATELYEENKDAFTELSETDSVNLANHLKTLNEIITKFESPSKVSITVGKALNNISTLQELSGGAVETDVFGYIDNIQSLLTQAKAEYRNGNSQKAYDLVSSAYLDNYEFVEDPLGEVDHELMEKIEVNMREELRSLIQSNASPDVIDAKVDLLLADLEVARSVVPEFGTIAMLILVISIVSVVALMKRNTLAIKI
ncbi:MAG: PEFG-CTERM sorting domain-containing protein [Crenarchaeota archaeon]|nr:MAG: PEFG-CTERM sorting domain-containing protein [Thermoproteota archaeon]RDJ34364.1 MAG: PEFG-CTERM sorting domain-containing protein [Thermoproteota archaeon]RDJ37172.1 MAG: PEFG-CTERM sorting domain-containing protein [Thermoproteota archaeon]RDJ37786.1 MAG: PEFG-CTERM sorting domain-containing protein [Thermoproteota archaeon]